jgi:hypothetical protein
MCIVPSRKSKGQFERRKVEEKIRENSFGHDQIQLSPD